MSLVANEVEHGETVAVGDNRLSIDQKRAGGQRRDRRNNDDAATPAQKESLAALGIEAIPVPQSNVLDGINVTRRMLGRTWIDSDRCERGIEALRQYRREYDDKLKDWRRNPLHDWTSHGADALRTFACGYPGLGSATRFQRSRRNGARLKRAY
jgi:phage terminase large subunit